jgi:hypothetical protein
MRLNRRACSANICTALFISPDHIWWVSTNRRRTGLSSWPLSAYSMHRSRVSRFAPRPRPARSTQHAARPCTRRLLVVAGARCPLTKPVIAAVELRVGHRAPLPLQPRPRCAAGSVWCSPAVFAHGLCSAGLPPQIRGRAGESFRKKSSWGAGHGGDVGRVDRQ